MKPYERDIIGVGIGPSNLSLAALLHPLKSISSIFFDKKTEFDWHNGILFPHSQLQVHFLKDLVTLVDPTNKFSFLSFLHEKKRIYQFINSNFSKIQREEFNQYYQWVCQNLPTLKFNTSVQEIHLADQQKLSIVLNNKKSFLTNNLVIATGLSPHIPPCVKNKLSNSIFHGSKFLHMPIKSHHYKKILIVGGGQTGAELVLHYLKKNTSSTKITWLTRRDTFLPLDESPFVNELFTPAYSDYFFKLSADRKLDLLKKYKLFSDGISPDILQKIYQSLYKIRFIDGNDDIFSLLPMCDMINVTENGTEYLITVKHQDNNKIFLLEADLIILCTGYQYDIPYFLNPISDKFKKDNNGNLMIREDYSLLWNGPEDCKIYFQNAAQSSRGVADPNLSLSAWRSAVIINSITRKEIYKTENHSSFFNWKNISKNHKGSATKKKVKHVMEIG